MFEYVISASVLEEAHDIPVKNLEIKFAILLSEFLYVGEHETSLRTKCEDDNLRPPPVSIHDAPGHKYRR